jgi:hypothetical protein
MSNQKRVMTQMSTPSTERRRSYLDDFNKLVNTTVPRENRLSNRRYLMKVLLEELADI